ncbi:hypothetical protein CG398_03390 [Bifidobacteriaceae bacterium NR003]|nr:hypothetical protein CG398_03390 [Bifidobacteriaceae bacterium NR003]
MLRVESTVCFQRKRGLPSSIKTKAGKVSVVVHWEFCCVLCALTTCLSAAQRGSPNAGWFSRVWRVWGCVSLQTCATFPAFVVVLAGFGNICR